VNISVMATFNRMKQLVPSLDLSVISAALRDSTVLGPMRSLVITPSAMDSELLEASEG
jgi:hypothetical protein